MVRDADDDALAWDGDDDPTLEAPKKTAALPDGYTAVGGGAAEFDERVAAEAEAEAEPQSMNNATLISLGVFGGVYLLYAIGWLVGGLRLQVLALATLAMPFYFVSLALAVLAPAIWFLTVYLLTRGRRTWLRVTWLVAGVVLLVPWPFLMVGAVGQ
ncbi:hypothetical protein QL996_11765 [Planococcus sp. APC 4015]|nr:hypothetical protein [Planococcus sp. APC 4015]